jgi:VIT1/CCC1 family predicted Fe2+/Mn2+ transporter
LEDSLDAQLQKTSLDSLKDELNGAYLYDALAQTEKDEHLAEVYRRMAAVERKHAAVWVEQLTAEGIVLPTFSPDWRTRTLDWAAILITGLAGLLAGAISMALGEWLSVQSSRELYQHQIGIEKAEIAGAPEEEAEELALIYEARGIPQAEARQMSQHVFNDPASALETLAREELNVDPAELGGSAWEAALISFFLFSLGAILPVVPFNFMNGTPAITASLIFSALGLFIIGGGITLFTGRRVLYSGARQVLFGLTSAPVTFGDGRLIGVNLGK